MLHKIACDRCRAAMPWYVVGTLSAPERAVVAKHLESCAQCRAAMAEWRAIGDAVRRQAQRLPADQGQRAGWDALHAAVADPSVSTSPAHHEGDLPMAEPVFAQPARAPHLIRLPWNRRSIPVVAAVLVAALIIVFATTWQRLSTPTTTSPTVAVRVIPTTTRAIPIVTHGPAPMPVQSKDPQHLLVDFNGAIWSAGNHVPGRAIIGADGNLWFVETTGAAIGEYRSDGTLLEFPIFSPAGDLVRGQLNTIWFTEPAADTIGSIDTNGVLRQYFLPATSIGPHGAQVLSTTRLSPQGITLAKDGSIWFTETFGNAIGRLDVQGDYTVFPLPSAGSQPWGIFAASDGNLWFTEAAAPRVGILQWSNHQIREISSPPPLPGDALADITQVYGGNMLLGSRNGDVFEVFTLQGQGRIGFGDSLSLHPDGASSQAYAHLLVVGGNIWTTVPQNGALLELQISLAGTSSNIIALALPSISGQPFIANSLAYDPATHRLWLVGNVVGYFTI